MKYLIIVLALTITSNEGVSQILQLDRETVYVFAVDENVKNHVRGQDYWIGKSDTSELTRLDFGAIYAGKTIEICSKGDTLGPNFMTATNFHPLKDFESLEANIFKKDNLIQTFSSQGQAVKVYKVFLSGQFCKCTYRDFDGEIIPLYIPLENLTVYSSQGQAGHKDLSTFDYHFFRKVEWKK